MASVTTRTTSESRNGSSVQVPCDGTDGLQVDTMLSTVGVLRDYMNKTVQAGPEDMPEYGFLKDSSDNKKEPTEEDMDFADAIEFIDLTGGSKEAVTGTDKAMDDDDLLVEMLKEHLVVNTDSTSADASMVGSTATASTTRGSKTGSKSSRKREEEGPSHCIVKRSWRRSCPTSYFSTKKERQGNTITTRIRTTGIKERKTRKHNQNQNKNDKNQRKKDSEQQLPPE